MIRYSLTYRINTIVHILKLIIISKLITTSENIFSIPHWYLCLDVHMYKENYFVQENSLQMYSPRLLVYFVHTYITYTSYSKPNLRRRKICWESIITRSILADKFERTQTGCYLGYSSLTR